MENERTDWNRWLVIAALMVILSLIILMERHLRSAHSLLSR